MRTPGIHALSNLIGFLLLVLGTSLGSDKDLIGVPKWTVELSKSGLRPFSKESRPHWTRQQNVFFLSSQRIGVYQVNELAAPATLGPRGPSGGGGNFYLEIRTFDAQDGKPADSQRFRTNAEQSAVLPTRDGQWIVRTGNVMYLFSPEGKPLYSRNLPIEGKEAFEDWQVAVSPSGDQAILVHQQISSLPEPAIGTGGKAKVDVEAIATNNFENTQGFSLDRPLLGWAAGDGFLITSDPDRPSLNAEPGILNFDGQWTAFRPRNDCRQGITALRLHRIAAYGCGRLAVYSESGREIFSIKLHSGEIVKSVTEAGGFLAVELGQGEMMLVPGNAGPAIFDRTIRIEVFDMGAKKMIFSVPIHSATAYYAISPRMLAVVENAMLATYDLPAVSANSSETLQNQR